MLAAAAKSAASAYCSARRPLSRNERPRTPGENRRKTTKAPLRGMKAPACGGVRARVREIP
jgi:hypothetical protein